MTAPLFALAARPFTGSVVPPPASEPAPPRSSPGRALVRRTPGVGGAYPAASWDDFVAWLAERWAAAEDRPAVEETAYHEAGHALAAVLAGAKVHSVTIDPDRDDHPERYGDTQIVWRKGKLGEREYRERSILVALAGPVAEMLYTGDRFHPALVAEWAGDWADAWELASLLQPDERLRTRLLENAAVELYHLLDQEPHWAALAALADALLAHETLDSEEVSEIVAVWLR